MHQKSSRFNGCYLSDIDLIKNFVAEQSQIKEKIQGPMLGLAPKGMMIKAIATVAKNAIKVEYRTAYGRIVIEYSTI